MKHKSVAELQQLAEETLLYEGGRINNLVNTALAYFERYREAVPKGLYETAYLDFCHARLMVFQIIPENSGFRSFEAKKGPFYETYVELRRVIETESMVSELETHIGAKAKPKKKNKVPRKAVGSAPSSQTPSPQSSAQGTPSPELVGSARSDGSARSGGNARNDGNSRSDEFARNDGNARSDRQDPLSARFEKLRGPRPFPEAKSSGSVVESDHEVDLDKFAKVYPELPNVSELDLSGANNGNIGYSEANVQPLNVSPPKSNTNLHVVSYHQDNSMGTNGSMANGRSPRYGLPMDSTNVSDAPVMASPSRAIVFPKTTVINAESLAYYLKNAPELVLVLDVRDRRCFDAGHISAPHVVCVEPITIRPGMNEQELEDTFVLSPQRERESFENRRNYELIVYYDTDSTSNNYRTSENQQSATLHYLVTAIYDYAFSKPLKRPPCILVGGFQAWIDDFGGEYVEPPGGTIVRPPSSSPTNFNQGTSPPLARDVNDYFRSERRLSNISDMSSPSNSPPRHFHHHHLHTHMNGHKNSFALSHGAQSHVGPTMTIPMPPPAQAPPKPPGQALNGPPIAPYKSSPQFNGYNNNNGYYSTTMLNGHDPRQQTQVQQQQQQQPQALGEEELRNRASQFTTGLKNLGNTCYMNSIIQCLSGFPALSMPFVSGSYKKYVNVNSRLGYKGMFAKTYADLLTTMLRDDVSYVGPLALKDLSGRIRDTFRGSEQQDSQEFLTFLLDSLHEDLNASGDKERLKELTEAQERRREDMSVRVASTIEWERYLKSDYSLIVDSVQGQYQSKLKCTHCGYTSTTYNAFASLSLPIPLNYQTVSLKDCFDLFTRQEVLDGDDQWFCPHCNVKRKTLKTIRISRLPPVLIIHLKRFHTNSHGTKKLETFVTYPLSHLDLTEYWPASQPGDEQKLQGFPTRGQKPPFIYDLTGVTNHFGTLKGGHYTAFVKKGAKGWSYFDDTKVSINVNASHVVNQHAYVLFYQRRH
ncbi:ubiquitin carboxyl-terminal hydrolase 4 [Trichomonascus vanleenenianus]|uniref:ubiquitin carboxyl-terminal hydrolase family protein n=1 Tax=Trichomonascus vanleenenianus TaxID=2268995 RepID=UPI003EC9AC11